MRWIKRVMLGSVSLILVLAAVGAAYQRVGAARDRRAAPPPGRMVAVAGHELHLHCTGAGDRTVILEAGATGFAQTWSWIQPRLAQTARVCSYDRAGLGWSDAWETELDGTASARRLKALVTSAGEKGPYVLVGHPLGGTLVRIFAGQNPSAVIGLALIDPSHEDQLERSRQRYGSSSRASTE